MPSITLITHHSLNLQRPEGNVVTMASPAEAAKLLIVELSTHEALLFNLLGNVPLHDPFELYSCSKLSRLKKPSI